MEWNVVSTIMMQACLGGTVEQYWPAEVQRGQQDQCPNPRSHWNFLYVCYEITFLDR